jgi:hypothetical protein
MHNRRTAITLAAMTALFGCAGTDGIGSDESDATAT